MTKQNVALVLVVMLLSAHNADLILSGEKKLVGMVENMTGKDSCTCDTLKPGTLSAADSAAAEKDSLVYGLDISHWQSGELTHPASIADSITFVICKATEGMTYIDPAFEQNWKLLDTSKFIRGNYHFYRCYDDPVKQAEFYFNKAGKFSTGDFPPIVDIEEPKKGSECGTTKAMSNLVIFLQKVEELTGRVPMIYTNYDFGHVHLTDPAFSKYPLWIADDHEKPRLIGAWTKWTIWQKTSHYMVGKTRTDFDVFNGSLSDLKKFIQSSSIEK